MLVACFSRHLNLIRIVSKMPDVSLLFQCFTNACGGPYIGFIEACRSSSVDRFHVNGAIALGSVS